MAKVENMEAKDTSCKHCGEHLHIKDDETTISDPHVGVCPHCGKGTEEPVVEGLSVTVGGKAYGYVLKESAEVTEAVWLPRTLKPEHQDLVSEVSNKLGYEIDAAMAFAVALLEDVNAHEEAAKVNAALSQVEEMGEAKVDDDDKECVICGKETNHLEMDHYEKMVPVCDDRLCLKSFKREMGEAKEKPAQKLSEALGDGAAVYVGTYGKYAGGSIDGKWLNLEDYKDWDDFMEAARELHKDEADPELMFQDYQGFPEEFYSESYINPNVYDWLALSDDDRALLEVYIDEINNGNATIEQAQEHFLGQYASESDWAYDFIEQTGGLSPEAAASYLMVDNVTAREIGIEEADARVEDMSDDEVIEMAGMEEEFEAAEDKEAVLEKARDEVNSQIADEVEEKVKKDPIGYFVEELGAYTIEDLAKASFVTIDYEAYARDAQIGGDVSFIRKDGSVWVFSNH